MAIRSRRHHCYCRPEYIWLLSVVLSYARNCRYALGLSVESCFIVVLLCLGCLLPLYCGACPDCRKVGYTSYEITHDDAFHVRFLLLRLLGPFDDMTLGAMDTSSMFACQSAHASDTPSFTTLLFLQEAFLGRRAIGGYRQQKYWSYQSFMFHATCLYVCSCF